MRIKEITQFLEEIAPLNLQESYDNAGLIVGNKNTECTGALVCLDAIEAVVDEAIARNVNLIIAHHPIVFSGLKRFNGKNYIERTVMKAIKNDIAIYAIHTNLDNVYHKGVNERICQKIGLENLEILAPKKGILQKLITFCPTTAAENVRQAIFDAGAGQIGAYDLCSFNIEGKGTFRAGENASPTIGEIGKMHTESEIRIEVIIPNYLSGKIIKALKKAHPYEEVAYYLQALENKHQEIGAGMIGELKHPKDEINFLYHLKDAMQLKSLKFTALRNRNIKRVAVCGGSGSFLLNAAIGAGADIFITADYKYHQFFDADGRIIIADIGHYESEQYTIQLLSELLIEKFSNFAVLSTEVNTNPVNYL